MKNWKKEAKTALMVIVGNGLLALGVAAFILPNDLVSGGITGLGLIAEHWLGFDVGLGITVCNWVLFFVGALFLGKKFALSTLLATVVYPFELMLLRKVDYLQHITDDVLLAALFAGILVGAGMGLVIKEGASTGGMDIPPLILNKKFGLSVPMLIWVFDFVIIAFQILFATPEQLLYGIVVIIVTSVVMDKVMMLGESQTQVTIVSPKHAEISQAIQQKLDRGVTYLESVTGWLEQPGRVILSVISHRQLPAMKELVEEIDTTAFLVAAKVSEVRGRGFSLHKDHPARRIEGQNAE